MIGAAYRVSCWTKLYENNRTKELKRLTWVPVPNAMDGAGYTELVDHPDGAAHFGAWIAILEIASRQDPRGEIPQGSAGTSQALARISRLPAALFDEVIPRLLKLEWIECTQNQELGGIPQHGATIPQVPAVFPALKGMEGNGIEEKKEIHPLDVQRKKAAPRERPPKTSIATEYRGSRDIPNEYLEIANKFVPQWTGGKPQIEFERFLYWHEEKGKLRKDWKGAWRNWCANAADRIESEGGLFGKQEQPEAWPGQHRGRPAPGLMMQ